LPYRRRPACLKGNENRIVAHLRQIVENMFDVGGNHPYSFPA
jgi:hypothetical protein